MQSITQKYNLKECYLVAAVFTLLFVGFGWYQIVNTANHHTDTAMMLETIENTARTGLPLTNVNTSNYDAIPTWSKDAKLVCESPLIPSETISEFIHHAYFFVYPLAALSFLVPVKILLPLLNTLSFLTILLAVYVIARRNNVGVIGSVSIVTLTFIHPVWFYGFAGDYYYDRFFMSFALIYIALIFEKLDSKNPISLINYILIGTFGALACSVSERGIIMIAGFTLAIVVLYWNKFPDGRSKIYAILWSLLLISGFQSYISYLSENQNTGRFLAAFIQFYNTGFFDYLDSLLAVYGRQPTLGHTIKFLSINILLFGVLSIFHWRMAVIAFFALLPNLFATVGGAEKTGWLTHYHSMYFPFLVFAVVYGFAKLWGKISRPHFGKKTILGCMSIMAVGLIFLGSQGNLIHFNLKHLNPSAPFRAVNFFLYGDKSFVGSGAKLAKSIADSVPLGVSVTTTEGNMPNLYSGRKIYYYPMGLDVADYAVLNYVKNVDGDYEYTGAISYIGKTAELNRCLNERLRKANYDLENPVYRGNARNTVVLKRIK